MFSSPIKKGEKMAKYKGLIVDDSKGVRTTVAAMLQIIGHDSDAAASVEEARKLMAEKQYDYMLLDMEIPLVNGGEADTAIGPAFLMEIRRTCRKEVFPIIVITGRMLEKRSLRHLFFGTGQMILFPSRFP